MTTRPTMAKRHYIAIAAMLHRYNGQYPESMVDAFCNFFQEDNEKFDKARFIEACTTGKISARKGLTPR